MNPRPQDPFGLHRLALAPFKASASSAALERCIDSIPDVGEETFIAFLSSQAIGPLWLATIREHGLAEKISPELLVALKRQTLGAVGGYMLQQIAIQKAHQAFESVGIHYAVFKGVAVREQVLSDPALRPACDIDILVSPAQRTGAIQALVRAGFSLHAAPENISHEASLSDGRSTIDLHWDVMRPGRLRHDIVDQLLAGRTRIGAFWGIAENSALFVALVHPAFTKYLNTPHAVLVRLVELQRLVARNTNWAGTIELAAQCGVRTAAWASLHWVHRMLEVEVPDSVWRSLEPYRLRRTYLRRWIDHNLPSRLLPVSAAIKLGFTLPLQDKPSDALRAIVHLKRARVDAEAITADLQQAAAQAAADAS